ncbi:MAG TPA: hypothetical protein VH165_25435 [Kofleriaceae bacterium]|nr:hypothetical protein [Kofleriaceae bacterium]
MSSPPSPLWVLRMVEERFHRDDEGRPLREGRTPPEYLHPGEIEYKPCPYPGSRQAAHPMNVSALRQTSAHWDEIVSALGWLRASYAEARGSYGPDVMDVWRVSQLGSALPWFYVLRGDPMPAYAAALSKATLGTGILAQRLILKMLAERWLPPPFTTSALLALAESTGTLVGETEVCSAPDKMIARFLDVLVGSTPGSEPVPAGAATIDALIAERDRVLGFGACYSSFKLAMWLYYQARRFLYADVAHHSEPARDAMRALLGGPCEPPDFFVIEPDDLAAVPPALRAAWLGQLAALIVPFAPDASDRAVRACAQHMAAAMADPGPADPADPIDRALATFDRLDTLYGELIGHVEAGLRGAPYGESIDAATRDRLMMAPPRAAFAALRKAR